MRILVHEYFSGGGRAGRDVPESLGREGVAMRDALVADLAGTAVSHSIVATEDARYPLPPVGNVEGVRLSPGDSKLDELIGSADAAWFVAPETGGCLEALAARAEQAGTRLLGSGSDAVGRAADKASLSAICERHGLACPPTRVLAPGAEWSKWIRAARELGYPLVVKPRRGAGCEGVSLVGTAGELRSAVDAARRVTPGEALLLQRFIPGEAASVSVLADGESAVPLAVNGQAVQVGAPFHYDGGTTPLVHALSGRAAEVAVQACALVGGLRGYAGVDLVLTDSEAVVIEVNPRLTTSYLGVRTALGVNVAELALAACEGRLPHSLAADRRVRFRPSGGIAAGAGVPESRGRG